MIMLTSNESITTLSQDVFQFLASHTAELIVQLDHKVNRVPGTAARKQAFEYV
jgi:hypothetical protein